MRGWLYAIAVLLALGSAGTSYWIGRENARLQTGIATEARRHEQLRRQIEETERIDRLSKEARGGEQQAIAAIQAEAQRTRAAIADAEHQAETVHADALARKQREADQMSTNRDPTSGFVRLENFTDCGQATPTAAFCTLVWAASTGDDAKVQKLLKASAATRAKTEAYLAQLPENARNQWTSERFGSLWIASTLTDITALQVTGETHLDAEHAVVTFRVPGMVDDEKVKLNFTPVGWKVLLPENIATRVQAMTGSARASGATK
jgi:hypothetical protein